MSTSEIVNVFLEKGPLAESCSRFKDDLLAQITGGKYIEGWADNFNLAGMPAI